MGHIDNLKVNRVECSEATASTKVGFFDKSTAAAAQQTGVSAFTDNSAGTASTTIATVGATNSGDVSGDINNNFASIAKEFNDLRAALVAYGLLG